MGNLYTYLLENGLNSIELTPFIYFQNDNEVKLDFLEKVNRIDLKSNKHYTKDTWEFKLFEMLRDGSKSVENDEYDTILNDKIYIDGVALSDKNISDNVIFEFKSNDESRKDEKYELKLSEILPNYKDQTEALTKVIENFEPSIKPFLRSKVFKTRIKPKNQIFKEIHDSPQKVLTAYQILFLLLHKEEHPNVEVFKDKLELSTYFEEFGETEVYRNNVIEFLKILMHYDFTNVNLLFNGIEIKNCIYDEVFSIEEERLPKFIHEWINKPEEEKDEKLKLLYKLGLNKDDSEIVLLRKGLIENNKDIFEKGKVNLENDTLLLNTMKWNMNVQENGTDFSKQRVLLKDFYEKVWPVYNILDINLNNAIQRRKIYRTNPLNNSNLQVDRLKKVNRIIIDSENKNDFYKKKLHVPVLDSLKNIKYHFKKPDSLIFHRYSEESWKPYQKDIFDFIKTKEEWVIDDLLPVGFESYISLKLSEPEERFESEELLKNSKPIQELLPNLSNWSKSEEVSIRVYNESQLPVTLFYNNYDIKTIANITEIIDGEIYYTCFKERRLILSSLKNILNEDDYNSLFTFFNESKIIQEEGDAANKPISFSEEESRALESLFGNDIPPEFFKDYNLAACVSALVQLNLKGYDVSQAEIDLKSSHKYSQVEPVISLDGNTTLTVMCRSAIGGILYLRASSWNRLNDKIQLFVKTGRKDNQFHLFENKQSLLDISQTNYQVFRVEAESLKINTDSILKGEFDKEKIWLILKLKDSEKYNSIFDDIRDLEDTPEW